MSFLGLKVPHETARLLSELDVPGRKEPVGNFHVTILHLGDNVPIEELAKALIATYEVSSKTPPFSVSTNKLSCFPAKPDAEVPLICHVDSDELHDLRDRLCASYDAAGIQYSKKFPEYLPHLTLGWGKEQVADQRIPTVEWGAHELVLWGGDDGDRRVVITFPFSLKVASMPRRVLARYVGKSSLQDSPP